MDKKEYIERQEVYSEINELPLTEDTAMEILWTIDHIPTADVAPVVHGYWDDTFDGITPVCSVCGMTHRGFIRCPYYCPNCGAKMDL